MRHITLTDREVEVLHLIALEYTSGEIASKLYISRHTVNSHRKMIHVKLGVRNTAGLIRKSFELGILKISEKPTYQLKIEKGVYVKALSA